MIKAGFVVALAAAAVAAVTAVAPANAQDAAPARELSSFEQELMKPGPLPEMALGDPNAPVTIIEYASLTCGHCAHFHETAWPVLKAEYIDTGKVYFILREFPLDPLAAAGFMLARNAPGGRYFDVVDLMFERQKDWAYAENPVEALLGLSKQIGYSPATFESTLKDQALLDNINAVRTRASEEFKVDSTPTFFVNGEEVKGAMTPEGLRAKIDPLLAD
jgi:protein-disulfide isomerase